MRLIAEPKLVQSCQKRRFNKKFSNSWAFCYYFYQSSCSALLIHHGKFTDDLISSSHRRGNGKGDFSPIAKQHLLFIGHVGCGKSTELAHLTKELHAPNLYWVVRTDITDLLDINDLKYYDVWLAFAKEIIDAINQHNEKSDTKTPINIPEPEYGALRDWLTTIVREEVELKELTANLETSAQLGGTLPFLASLLAMLTN